MRTYWLPACSYWHFSDYLHATSTRAYLILNQWYVSQLAQHAANKHNAARWSEANTQAFLQAGCLVMGIPWCYVFLRRGDPALQRASGSRGDWAIPAMIVRHLSWLSWLVTRNMHWKHKFFLSLDHSYQCCLKIDLNSTALHGDVSSSYDWLMTIYQRKLIWAWMDKHSSYTQNRSIGSLI